MQDFKQPNQDDCYGRDPPTTVPIGEAESQSDQYKGERMFAILPEAGMGPQAGWAEGHESNRRGQQPGQNAHENRHALAIARNHGLLLQRRDQIVVWLMTEN